MPDPSRRHGRPGGGACGNGLAVDPTPPPDSTLARPVLRNEVLLVLAVSLGASGVYAALSLLRKLLAPIPLSQSQATLNGSVVPNQAWLDLVYQLVGIGFGVVPALLALHLLTRDRIPPRAIGVDGTRPGSDLRRGALLAAVIGIPGLLLYLAAYALGISATIVPSGLPDVWWRVPVLVLSAAMNATLEEVVVVGYLITRLRQLGRSAPWAIGLAAVLRGSLPPLPGVRRVRRQRGDGRRLRLVLPAHPPGDAADRGAHDPRHGLVRRLHRARRARVLAALSYSSPVGRWACRPRRTPSR